MNIKTRNLIITIIITIIFILAISYGSYKLFSFLVKPGCPSGKKKYPGSDNCYDDCSKHKDTPNICKQKDKNGDLTVQCLGNCPGGLTYSEEDHCGCTRTCLDGKKATTQDGKNYIHIDGNPNDLVCGKGGPHKDVQVNLYANNFPLDQNPVPKLNAKDINYFSVPISYRVYDYKNNLDGNPELTSSQGTFSNTTSNKFDFSFLSDEDFFVIEFTFDLPENSQTIPGEITKTYCYWAVCSTTHENCTVTLPNAWSNDWAAQNPKKYYRKFNWNDFMSGQNSLNKLDIYVGYKQSEFGVISQRRREECIVNNSDDYKVNLITPIFDVQFNSKDEGYIYSFSEGKDTQSLAGTTYPKPYGIGMTNDDPKCDNPSWKDKSLQNVWGGGNFINRDVSYFNSIEDCRWRTTMNLTCIVYSYNGSYANTTVDVTQDIGQQYGTISENILNSDYPFTYFNIFLDPSNSLVFNNNGNSTYSFGDLFSDGNYCWGDSDNGFLCIFLKETGTLVTTDKPDNTGIIQLIKKPQAGGDGKNVINVFGNLEVLKDVIVRKTGDHSVWVPIHDASNDNCQQGQPLCQSFNMRIGKDDTKHTSFQTDIFSNQTIFINNAPISFSDFAKDISTTNNTYTI